MVQIGNEISNGFLWPDGNVWKSGKWDVFCGLIKAGIAGAKEADPSVKIMLHLAWGGQNAKSRSFLDKALAQGVEFDIIGQSYYPKWHGHAGRPSGQPDGLGGPLQAGHHRRGVFGSQRPADQRHRAWSSRRQRARHVHLGADEMGRACVVRRQGEHEARDRSVPKMAEEYGKGWLSKPKLKGYSHESRIGTHARFRRCADSAQSLGGPQPCRGHIRQLLPERSPGVAVCFGSRWPFPTPLSPMSRTATRGPSIRRIGECGNTTRSSKIIHISEGDGPVALPS